MTVVGATTVPRFNFIDALRGWAILAVVTVHTSQHIDGISSGWRTWLDTGARGVQLFFIASALTLMLSWHHRGDGSVNFYVRRLFRIAPLFWLAILGYSILAGGVSPVLAVTSLLFVHALHPATIDSAVPGGWSIGVEMLFYAVFPLLAWSIRGPIAGVVFFVISFAIARYSPPFVDAMFAGQGLTAAQTGNFNFLWFGTQLPVFALGIVLYFAITRWKWPASVLWLELVLAACLATIAIAPFLGWLSYIVPLLAIVTYCLSQGAGRYMMFALIREIGKLSFGIYLWHFFVLEMLSRLPLPDRHLAKFVVLYASTILISGLCSFGTYRGIERPLVRFGERWIRARRRPPIAISP